MPPFLLIIFLVITATLLVQFLILIPIGLLKSLNLPNWLLLAMVVTVLSWFFGE